MVRVAVVGAGIIGVSSALKIKEKYPEFEVVIISKDFTPLTTGDNSAGLWLPYIISENQDELITKWGVETYRFLHQMWRRGGLNISFLPVYCLKRKLDDTPAPQWSRHVFGFNQFDSKQLKYFSDLYSASPEFVEGYYFSTFVTPPQVVLPHLTRCFQEAGGKIVEGTVTSLKDDVLSPFDVVVNCTGVRAREIVPDDRVFSVRGQVVKVEAPWIAQCVLDLDGDNYILPNFQTCVLGGTHQENDYSTQLNDKDTEFILKGCRRILPGLENAKIVNNWAGLRPARHETRIEAEKANGKLYIHNYGHGGSGFTLFWGCATDVVQLFESNLGVKSHI